MLDLSEERSVLVRFCAECEGEKIGLTSRTFAVAMLAMARERTWRSILRVLMLYTSLPQYQSE